MGITPQDMTRGPIYFISTANMSAIYSHITGNATNCSNVSSEFMQFENPLSNVVFQVLLTVISAAVFLLCFVGNILVLFVIIRNIKMRTLTNVFLANLAVADLFVGIFCMVPSIYEYFYMYWYLGKVMCKLYKFFETVNVTASMMLLEVIAVERYIAINHPLKARRLFTRCKMCIAQFLVWLIAGAYSVPLLFLYSTIEIFEDEEHPQVYCMTPGGRLEVYKIITFVFWYVIPLATMTVMYTLIAKTLWRSSVPNQVVVLGRRVRSDFSDDSANGESSKSSSSVVNRPRSLLVPHAGVSKTINRDDIFLNEKYKCPNGGITFAIDVEYYKSTTKTKPSMCFHGRSKGSCPLEDSSPSTLKTTVSQCDSLTPHTSPPSPRFKPVMAKRPRFSTSSASSDSDRAAGDHASEELIALHNSSHTKRKSSTRREGSETKAVAGINGYRVQRRTTGSASFCRCRVTSLRMSRRRVIRLLIVVLITFAVLVLPNHIRLIMFDFGDLTLTTELKYVSPAMHILMYLNSALNPLLYSLLSESFRRSLKESLSCFRRVMIIKRRFPSRRIEITSGCGTKTTAC